MKHKIISTVLVLGFVLGMGTAVAADEQGYNGTALQGNDVLEEKTVVENMTVGTIENSNRLLINQQQFQRTIDQKTVQLEEYVVVDELIAGVYTGDNTFDRYEAIMIGDKTYKFWREIENSIDDIVVVTNDAEKSDTTAYIRTVFAFPVFSDGETHLHLNFHRPEILEEVEGIAEIEGKKYKLYVYNYDTTLAPGETAEPSLLEYVFDKDVSSEMFDEFPQGTYKILITSQAVQESGFSTFAKAFNGAFLNVTASDHPWN